MSLLIYPVEGAFNEDGRGMTIWDTFSHTPGKTTNGDNGDIATDHYHLFTKDIEIMKEMGMDSYRFSLSWSRIQPDGEGEVNKQGIEHYNAVIDSLLDADIIPFVTLFHWDTPVSLEEKYESWLNADIEHYFAKYADICFHHFGDRVKHWLTFNEPMTVALNGYDSGTHAPGRCSDRSKCKSGDSSTEPYVVAHNMLNAHAAAVQLYRDKYQTFQGGEIGITLNSDFAYPFSDSSEDVDASQRNLEFQAGWYADPIYFGDYPESMKSRVGDRLPKFTSSQSARIKGSQDFYGLNHYTSKYVANKVNEDIPESQKSYSYDQGTAVSTYDESGIAIGEQAASPWLYIVPKGIGDMLLWIDERYSPSHIYITENGVDLVGEGDLDLEEAIHDADRVEFYETYLSHALSAKSKGVPLKGYFAWSLMDNFEWADGYYYKFGMLYVDRDVSSSTYMQRWQKDSARWYANFTKYYPML